FSADRLYLVADTGRDAARRLNHHVGNVDWHRLVRYSALNLLRRIRAGVALHHHDAFHCDLARKTIYFEHLASLAFVASCDDPHQIIFFDLDSEWLALSAFLPPLICNFRHRTKSPPAQAKQFS